MTRIEIDPDLLEEALFLSLRHRPLADAVAALWHRGREALYRSPAGAERDRAFRELAAGWFARLELSGPIVRALERCPRVKERIETIRVRRALRSREEGSEVLATGSARCPEHIFLALRALTFLDPPALERLVLRELLHAEDILDPAFAFDPRLDADPDSGHARRELLRDRFRVLWEARVQGRMAREAEALSACPSPDAGFRRAFGPGTDPSAVDALFRDAWSGRLATHRALLEAATRASLSTVEATERIREDPLGPCIQVK